MRRKENPDVVLGCTATRNASLGLFNGGHGAEL